jgi:hypothetical protein
MRVKIKLIHGINDELLELEMKFNATNSSRMDGNPNLSSTHCTTLKPYLEREVWEALKKLVDEQ